MNSLYPDGKCFMCKRTEWLEHHHIFNASNKKNSEKYGAVVTLCHKCHNEPPDGVHFNKERRQWLQADAQKRIMEHHGITKEEFIQIFGKNYLED